MAHFEISAGERLAESSLAGILRADDMALEHGAIGALLLQIQSSIAHEGDGRQLIGMAHVIAKVRQQL